MNKEGQMGMGFIVGIMVAVMSLIFFLALTPVITSMFGISRGSDASNCPGYTDPQAVSLGANNHSYNPALNSDALTCTITGFGPGMIVLAVIFGIIAGILSGKFGQQEQQSQYPSYGQY
jgi:hypothetical protein